MGRIKLVHTGNDQGLKHQLNNEKLPREDVTHAKVEKTTKASKASVKNEAPKFRVNGGLIEYRETTSNDAVPELQKLIAAQKKQRTKGKKTSKAPPQEIFVFKRDGRREPYNPSAIERKIRGAADGLPGVKTAEIAALVCDGIVDGTTTHNIDELTIKIASSKFHEHLDYSKFACRIALSDHYKTYTTAKTFSESVKILCEKGVAHEDYYELIFNKLGAENVDAIIDESRDQYFDILGLLKFMNSYLMAYHKLGPAMNIMERIVVERPQHLYGRAAARLCDGTLEDFKRIYDLLSFGLGTMATPTLANSFKKTRFNLTSCFLVEVEEDSVEGIMNTAKHIANIASHAGGVAVYLSKLRPRGAASSSGAEATGPAGFSMIMDTTMFNMMQGPKIRRANAAYYIDLWHPDCLEIIAKRNHETTPPEDRYRSGFPAVIACDLFMKRVEKNQPWSFFSPQAAPELLELHGEAFEKKYLELEAAGRYWSQKPAAEIYEAIAENIGIAGTPYVIAQDAINEKTNQQNLGKIKFSNLCTEIVEVTTGQEPALCNLSTVVISKFVEGFPATAARKRKFDFEKLWKTSYDFAVLTDRLIDNTGYPYDECGISNSKHRPIGCGVQGLADAVFMMGMVYDSDEARKFIKDVCETHYHACISASADLAEKYGAYEGFEGSPMSQGKFQFDQWNDELKRKKWILRRKYVPTRDFDPLRKRVRKVGLRNSLSTSHPPTISTSEILGNSEGTDPFITNSGKKNAQHGDFTCVNIPLVKELMHLGLWTPQLGKAISATGSIQKLTAIPLGLRKKALTAYEINKTAIALTRTECIGPVTCQAISSNSFYETPTVETIKADIMTHWKLGAKTLIYYGKNKSAANGANKDITNSMRDFITRPGMENDMCSIYDMECTACSA